MIRIKDAAQVEQHGVAVVPHHTEVRMRRIRQIVKFHPHLADGLVAKAEVLGANSARNCPARKLTDHDRIKAKRSAKVSARQSRDARPKRQVHVARLNAQNLSLVGTERSAHGDTAFWTAPRQGIVKR